MRTCKNGGEGTIKTSKYVGFILILVTLFASSSFAFAWGDKSALRGLEGFHVQVEPLNSEIERRGLTSSQIKEDVESRLRLAGISVLSNKECWETKGEPRLIVAVNAIHVKLMDEQGGIKIVYPYHVEVRVAQLSYLVRPVKRDWRKIPAITYVVSFTSVNPDLDRVRTMIKCLINTLIKDYLSMNPK